MTTTKRSKPPAKPAKQPASKARMTDAEIAEAIKKHCGKAEGWRDALRMFRKAGASCAGQRFRGLFEAEKKKAPAKKAAPPKPAPKTGKPTGGQKVTKTTQAGRQTVASAGDQEPVEPEKVEPAA